MFSKIAWLGKNLLSNQRTLLQQNILGACNKPIFYRQNLWNINTVLLVNIHEVLYIYIYTGCYTGCNFSMCDGLKSQRCCLKMYKRVSEAL